MANTDRLYRIESMIRHRGHVSKKELLDALEVSPATLKRDLEYLRSRLGAPIEYDASVNGYRLSGNSRAPLHELPGLWFSERELHALLGAYQLLGEIDPDGAVSRHLGPLRERVQHLLASRGSGPAAPSLTERVRIVSAQRRPVDAEFFERVGHALMTRRRLGMTYLTRGRAERSVREVSPQRLVHYRSTWYLDAWCHRAEAFRRFALDAMEAVTVQDAAAQDIPLEDVAAALDAGYGIFAGRERQWARLRVSPLAARWIGREQWHPEQIGQWLPDGSFELRVPFVEDRELLMDVLRQGGDVEVLGPQSLRERARQAFLDGARTHEGPAPASGAPGP